MKKLVSIITCLCLSLCALGQSPQFEKVVATGAIKPFSGNTLTIPIPTSVAPGNLITIHIASIGAYGQRIFDNRQSRYYAVIIPGWKPSGSSDFQYLTYDYAAVDNGLSPGDSITVDMVAGTPTVVVYSVLEFSGIQVTGRDVTSLVDQRSGSFGTTSLRGKMKNYFFSSNFTDPTDTPTELLVGAIGINGPLSDAVAMATEWTEPTDGATGTFGGTVNSNMSVHVGYRISSSVDQFRFFGNLIAIRNYTAVIGTFR